MFSNLLFAAIGGAIGAVACYLWRNARVASLQTELQGKEASHKTEIENLRSLYEQQIEHLKITEEKLQTTFKAAAETVLDQGAKRYEKSAEKDLQRITAESEGKIELKKQAIDSTVKELKDQLKNAGDKISEFEKERTDKYAKIEQQIGNLFNQEQKLIEETQHLKSALTTSNAVRGKWGELVLRNILQLSDLTEGVDYTIQKSTTNDDGTRIRPDCVLKLPNSNSYVAIDAKASLYESYLAASGSITEEQRIEIHKDFAGKLRGRMKDLTKKEYQDYVTDSVPYVIMFIPSEAAMRAALEVDQSLLVDCAKQKVILTSPATLMPLIFLIADAWRQHRIATQAAVLTEEVKELGKRLERFIGRLGGVQKGIEAASKAWNEAISQSWMGRLSVVRSFDKIKEMGNLLPQLSDPPEVTIEPVVIPISDTPQLLSEQS